MYAVVQAGGHQYRVHQGNQIEIDRQEGVVGTKVVFDKVLMLGGSAPVLGTPMVAGARVEGKIVAQSRREKVIIFKFKRRKNSKRKRGHAQPVTVVEITDILR